MFIDVQPYQRLLNIPNLYLVAIAKDWMTKNPRRFSVYFQRHMTGRTQEYVLLMLLFTKKFWLSNAGCLRYMVFW